MELSLLCKAFKYQDHPGSKGAIFHGGIYVDDDGLYLAHNKHTWESGNTAMAAFGLLGALIAWLMTRKKKVEHPFPGMKYGDLDADKRSAMNFKGIKDEALLCIIPKAEVGEFTTGLMKGTRIKVGSITVVPVGGGKGKVLKQMKESGYEGAEETENEQE